MTIVSVVYVPEGIAMSADSRLISTSVTDEGVTERLVLTDSAQKLVLINKGQVGVSFTGDAIVQGKTVADHLRIFDIEKVEKLSTIQDIVTSLQAFVAEKQINVLLLVAGFQDDEPHVYSINQQSFNRLNKREDEILYNASWTGDTEAADKLLISTNVDYKLMPLRDAIDFSEFIVETSIKYQRFEKKIATCGGPIDLLVITKDYTKFTRHKILHP